MGCNYKVIIPQKCSPNGFLGNSRSQSVTYRSKRTAQNRQTRDIFVSLNKWRLADPPVSVSAELRNTGKGAL